jgi:RimJ/RimL family protein N-acetyltransferase
MGEAGDRERKGPLLTRRLRLRPARERDMIALAKLAAAESIRQNLTIALVGGAAGPGGETYVLERQADRVLIGAGGFAAVARGDCGVDLALWIGQADWGCGYGTEATQALIDRAFAGPAVNEVWGGVRVTNVRGRQLVEKCGFQARGTGMARASAIHGAFPVERFVLTRRAWASLKAWGAAAAAEDGGNGPHHAAA